MPNSIKYHVSSIRNYFLRRRDTGHLTHDTGFTLVELLVVMALIGMLATLIAGNFRNTKQRGNDAKRKSDLRQTANSLELFFSDHGVYPPATATNEIEACPYPDNTCVWGEGQFGDGNAVYLSKMPEDPTSSHDYYYRVFGTNNQKFQLFARLENSADQNCIEENCNDPVAYLCGANNCNFAVTSANTTPTE